MINLLPLEKKNKVNGEQKMRIVNAYLYMIGSCFVLALISLLPSYFPAVVKNHIAHQKLNDLNNLPVSQLDQETNVVVQDVNSKIALIDVFKGKVKNPLPSSIQINAASVFPAPVGAVTIQFISL